MKPCPIPVRRGGSPYVGAGSPLCRRTATAALLLSARAPATPRQVRDCRCGNTCLRQRAMPRPSSRTYKQGTRGCAARRSREGWSSTPRTSSRSADAPDSPSPSSPRAVSPVCSPPSLRHTPADARVWHRAARQGGLSTRQPSHRSWCARWHRYGAVPPSSSPPRRSPSPYHPRRHTCRPPRRVFALPIAAQTECPPVRPSSTETQSLATVPPPAENSASRSTAQPLCASPLPCLPNRQSQTPIRVRANVAQRTRLHAGRYWGI